MTIAEVHEAAFQHAVVQLAHHLRLRVAHFRPARLPNGRVVTPAAYDAPGFPDLVIIGPAGLLWRELKTETNDLEPEQRRWESDLLLIGEDYDVWRPADLNPDGGRIKRELREISRLGVVDLV